MKRSHERLGRLERVRRIQEEVARAAWLDVEQQRVAIEGRLMHALHAREQMFTDLNNAREAGSAQFAVRSEPLLDTLRDRIARLRERERTLVTQAAALRKPWLERRVEASALERLRKRSQEAEQAEREKREMAIADELASSRAFIRNQRSQLPVTNESRHE